MSLNSLRSKPSYMTGIHYLEHMQYTGKEHGDRRMINRRLDFSKCLYSKDLFAHYGCVNAIEFSNDGEWLVSGGDDKRILIWNIDQTLSGSRPPKAMKGEHNSNIFCLGFSTNHSKLFSAGNDEQVIAHDVTTGDTLDVFLHDEAVYGLAVDPVNENIFASACDDGRVLVWDIRLSTTEPYTLASSASAYHAVMYNPVEPRFLATANAKDGVCLWDIRKPKVHLMKYGPTLLSQSAMSVRFNSQGTHLLALRRRFPPVLYELTSPQPAAEFDHHEYYNSCTMKSCCFAGERDQYILSGSDDFKLYVWKIPDAANFKKGVWVNKSHLVLRGHRSIVNQVRYNSTYGILASSGVEKIVKIWSSFPLAYKDDISEYISAKDSLRKVYSHEEYINLVLENGQFMTHDYSHHSVQEDQRMMAFFDSLVQRDIEGWTSDSSVEAMNTLYILPSSDSQSSSDSLSSSSDDDAAQGVTNPCEVCNNTNRAPTNIEEAKNTVLALYARSLIDEGKGNTSNNGEEAPDPSLDRISMLIAQKRKEQVKKTSERLQKHLNKQYEKLRKKSLHLLKKRKKYPLISGNENSSNTIAANGHGSKSASTTKTGSNLASATKTGSKSASTTKTGSKSASTTKTGSKSASTTKTGFKSVSTTKTKSASTTITGPKSATTTETGSNSALTTKTDRRKVLRKKRAKLSKDTLLKQKSSDSDSDGSSREVNGECSKHVNFKSEDNSKASTEFLSAKQEVSNSTLNNSVISETNLPQNEDNVELPNSTNNINGTETSNSSTISNSLINLPTKDSKNNFRNYRKRRFYDTDED